MGAVSATDRRGHHIEIGKKKISRKNSVSHWNKLVAILTAGIITERSLQGRETGEMEALV